MLQLQNKSVDKGPPLWLVEKKYTIGSDTSCDIVLLDASLEPVHVELQVDGDRVTVVNIAKERVSIDDKALADTGQLLPGSQLKLAAIVFELIDPKVKKEELAEEAHTNWALKALNTALADKHFPLHGSQVIGRAQECDVCLAVVHLSRKHAKITVTDAGLMVEDLNSANGTFINNKKVSKSMAIAGDEISFDTLHFRVLGPKVETDNTAVRTSASDVELTTIRPALTVSDSDVPKELAEGYKPRSRARLAGDHTPIAAKQPAHSSKDTSRPDQSSEDEPSNKGYGMLLIGAAVLIAAFLAWYFLK